MKKILMSAVIALGAANPVLAQEVANSQAGPNWLVNCTNQDSPDQLACAMSQSAIVVATGARVLTAIFEPAGADDYMMSLILPFGLDLTAGVALAADGQDWKTVPVNTCDAEACYARVTLQANELDLLTAGATFEISLLNVQSQTVDVALTLYGFSGALAMLKH